MPQSKWSLTELPTWDEDDEREAELLLMPAPAPPAPRGTRHLPPSPRRAKQSAKSKPIGSARRAGGSTKCNHTHNTVDDANTLTFNYQTNFVCLKFVEHHEHTNRHTRDRCGALSRERGTPDPNLDTQDSHPALSSQASVSHFRAAARLGMPIARGKLP